MLASDERCDYYAGMKMIPQSGQLTTAAELFTHVSTVDMIVEASKWVADERAAKYLGELAGQINHEEAPSALGELDGGVVNALYGLMPQIREHLERRAAGEARPHGVLGRMEDSPEATIGALWVAAQANGADIIGYHGQVTITATPESTLEGLREDFHQAWQAVPPTDPFM
jgi:hypothetical protein